MNKIDTTRTYQQLYNDGIINDTWLQINDEIKNLKDKATLVLKGDKIVFIAFNTKSAEEYLSHLNQLDLMDRGEPSIYDGFL